MDLAKQPLPQEMELANQPPPQEIPLCQTSSLCPNSAAIGAVSLPAQAAVQRVALVLPDLQLLRARGWEAGRETVELPCLFRLSPVQGRESDPERRKQSSRSSRRSKWPVLFRTTLSLSCPTRLLFHPTH